MEGIEFVCWVLITPTETGVRVEWNGQRTYDHQCGPEDREAVYAAAVDEIDRLMKERYGI